MAKFTENQTAVLANIDLSTGVWFDTLVNDIAAQGLNKDKKQARVTVNQLIKKGTLVADTTVEEGSTWLELKEAPEPWFRSETLPSEDADDLVGDIRADVEEGTPEDEVEDAIAELNVHTQVADVLDAKAKEIDEDLIGEVATTHTENYTVREWTGADEVEWTEVTFPDKSHALKRRKKVNGAWRTDYWGAEFEGDKETYTTAKRFKMAKAYGSFTHTDK